MTERKTLLHPLESAQRLALADRETLQAIHAAVGDCGSLIAEQGAALQKTADRQFDALQASTDAVGRLVELIDRHGKDCAARHAELMEAAREARAAVAGLATRHDETGVESAAAVTDAVPVLSATVEALRKETHGARAERKAAQDSQTRTLVDVVRGAASLGRRFGCIEQALGRDRSDFWLNGVAIPLSSTARSFPA